MSILKKIKQTNEAKALFTSPMLSLLLNDNEVMTKSQLSEKLNISERMVRNEIARCAMYYAVIATSDKKGYRLAKNINDLHGETLLQELEEVEHQIHEVNSRIKCLKKRLKPLIAYKKVAEKKRDGNLS